MRSHTLFAVCDESLFFGSARPIQAGEAHHAEGLFPPPPSTFQGAVRASLYRSLKAQGLTQAAILERVGPPQRLPEGWALDGPWAAAVEVEDGAERLVPWVPLPLCAVDSTRRNRDPKEGVPQGRSSHSTWSLRSRAAWPEGLVVDDDAPPELVLGEELGQERWISATDLYTLLSTGRVRAPDRADPPFARAESRSGLALQADRTADRGLLYFHRGRRMSGVVGAPRSGLVAWLSADDGSARLILDQPLRLGRRNRALPIESPAPRAVEAWADLQAGRHIAELSAEQLPDGVHAWLILASPVALDRPPLGRPDRPVVPGLGPVRVEVRSALPGRPLHLGGISLAQAGGPTSRPVRAMTPAGASWLIRLDGGTPEDRRNALLSLHHTCTLGDPDARSFGFGRTWIAPLPAETV